MLIVRFECGEGAVGNGECVDVEGVGGGECFFRSESMVARPVLDVSKPSYAKVSAKQIVSFRKTEMLTRTRGVSTPPEVATEAIFISIFKIIPL